MMITLKELFNFRTVMMSLLIAWSMGLGFRFILEYVLQFLIGVTTHYDLSLFDTLFDWGGLFVLSIANLVIVIRDNYLKAKK